MAILYKTDGTFCEVEPKNGTDFKLKELQGYVGGLIEVLPLGNDTIMVCNEEGKLEGLPVNREACRLYNEAFGIDITGEPFDVIVGDVVICRDKEVR